ncbi:hypothetical protein IFR05_012260 [Cadophora sp. M221]|nr:hypothetical protein IFR05_012260 [Cadophora sp. M221]
MEQYKRYLTSLDPLGRSVLTHDTSLTCRPLANGTVARAYALASIPANIASNTDLSSYISADHAQNEASHAGLETALPNGVVMTYFELGPGAETVFHRTLSVDFTILIEGGLEMELDSGEKVQLKPGDSVVQRATMHKWKNLSDENPVRLIGILCACQPVEVGGKMLREEWIGP